MRICFLTNSKLALSNTENRMYLTNAVLQLGHEVSLAFTDSLASHDGQIFANTARVDGPLSVQAPLDYLNYSREKLSRYDVIWVLSMGKRETYLDKIQMLKFLSEKQRVVNAPEALFFLHSKTSQSDIGDIMQYPQTHVSSDFETLWNIYQSGGDWIVKPAGESLGKDVYKLVAGDSNARAILQSMTGYDGRRYCLLQRYLPEVALGEKRVLLAGGKVIGQYAKKAGIDHRGNLHQEAEASLCTLTAEEKAACERVGKYLLEKGVYFTGLDMAWPYLVEWNVLNPGGIGTIDRLGGGNLAKTAILNVLASSQNA